MKDNFTKEFLENDHFMTVLLCKNFGSHSMTLLYPNLFYNKVCYKVSALYTYIAGSKNELLAYAVCQN